MVPGAAGVELGREEGLHEAAPRVPALLVGGVRVGIREVVVCLILSRVGCDEVVICTRMLVQGRDCILAAYKGDHHCSSFQHTEGTEACRTYVGQLQYVNI